MDELEFSDDGKLIWNSSNTYIQKFHSYQFFHNATNYILVLLWFYYMICNWIKKLRYQKQKPEMQRTPRF